MEITNVIKSILIKQDKLYIDGFATLKTKFKSAQILPSGEILPPTKEIFIDFEDSQKDDTLLYAIMNEGLTKSEAEKQIKQYVADINKHLADNKNFEVKGLGFIYKDKEGKIKFNQTTKESLLVESPGFDAINPVQISDNNSSKDSNKKSKKRKKTEIKKKTEQKNSKNKKEQKTKQKTHKNINSKKTSSSPKVMVQKKEKKETTWIISAVIIALIVVAVIYFFSPIKTFFGDMYSKYLKKQHTTIQQTDTIVNNNQSTDTIQFQLDKEYKKLLDAKIGDLVNVDLGNNYKKFYIIVGSFSSKDNAVQLSKQLKNMGYKPVIVYKNGQPYFRVSIGGYEKADTVISEYRDYTTKYGQAWILINKK